MSYDHDDCIERVYCVPHRGPRIDPRLTSVWAETYPHDEGCEGCAAHFTCWRCGLRGTAEKPADPSLCDGVD